MFATYNLINRNILPWLCWLGCIYSVVTLFSIHSSASHSSTESHVQNVAGNPTDVWYQPSAINTRYPTLISSTHWDFDYSAIEALLTQIHSRESFNNNQPNSTMTLAASDAELFSKAIQSLPKNLSAASLQRIQFLITKGFPDDIGHPLAKVTIAFYQLQSTTDTHTEHKPADLPKHEYTQLADKMLAFKNKADRQDHFLGKDVAHQLFGKQRAIAYYLLQRRAIKEDTQLSSEQKIKQLKSLKDTLAND